VIRPALVHSRKLVDVVHQRTPEAWCTDLKQRPTGRGTRVAQLYETACGSLALATWSRDARRKRKEVLLGSDRRRQRVVRFPSLLRIRAQLTWRRMAGEVRASAKPVTLPRSRSDFIRHDFVADSTSVDSRVLKAIAFRTA
jgi:hypothetical protein